MPETGFEVDEPGPGGGGQALAGVAEVVEREFHTDGLPCSYECLVDGVAACALAVAADDEELRPGVVVEVFLDDRDDVGRDRDDPPTRGAFRVLLESRRLLEEFDPV